jgi:hypothetical protein
MEPYVGNIIVGGQRYGKAEFLITRFKRCTGEWHDIEMKPRGVVKDSKSPNILGLEDSLSGRCSG